MIFKVQNTDIWGVYIFIVFPKIHFAMETKAKLKTWRLMGSIPIVKQLTTAEVYFKKHSCAIWRLYKIIPFVCLFL